MALVDIVYIHSAEPTGKEIRRTSIKAMEEYIDHVDFEMKLAGVGTSFVSKHQDGAKNDVIVNGKTVAQILDGLEIRKPEVDSEDGPVKVIAIERAPDDWNTDVIEDIPDLLMKNALSKAFAEADSLRIKEML